ncbi:MAG: low molecular weight phosphatase family protein [Candidatus Vogelbacteria bacterium]|nr:low molecular weight phosphatase family protein [Candidatus Vogelbacteria bacterium]
MKVLFICKGNWNRSQIAEATYNKITGATDATSAGTYVGIADEPEGILIKDRLSQKHLDTLKSYGLDVSDKRSKRLTPKMLKEAEIAISMAEEPYVPDFLRNDPKVIWWDVEDNMETEKTYQQVFGLVSNLIKQLNKS